MFSRSFHPAWLVLLLVGFVASACGRSSGPKAEDTLILDAREAIQADDQQKALEMLSQSLATRPTSYGYYERAKLYADMGNDAAALADCQKGLELYRESRELNWLQSELKKPKTSRFKGTSAQAPQKQ
jgi:tetratricopeptide (TPR) repeat protein